MKVVFVNPIVYTPENAVIPKVDTITSTMSYDLCLAFRRAGVDMTLVAAEEWKPRKQSEFPFHVVWMKSHWKRFFPIHRIPVNLGLIRYLRHSDADLIITSEVFSIDSLICSVFAPKKTIIWHEMAKHNRMGGGLLSRFWYNVIPKLFMRKVLVVGRSDAARTFISRYCARVSDTVIGHGVNLDVFRLAQRKTDAFCVVSQLIGRKRIDGIIRAFGAYVREYDADCKLYVIGDGEKREELERLSASLGLDDSVRFLGQLDHADLQTYLSEAKAMLVNTAKDNSMLSIVESVASATPVITTSVPLNAAAIRANGLGIVKDGWNEEDLHKLDEGLDGFVDRCRQYRETLSTDHKVDQFLGLYKAQIEPRSKQPRAKR